MANYAKHAKDTVGALRRINIGNFVVYNADPRYGSIIGGIPGHDIEDVKLNNIRICYQGGGAKEQAALVPPEDEDAYPEPRMFGDIPAYGFFIRHVKGIEMNDVQVSYLKKDQRPAILVESVDGLEVNSLKARHATGVPELVLNDVENFVIRQSSTIADTNLKSVKRQEY